MIASSHYDTIVIGAGMSGLAAGIRLAMFDKKVLIVEKHHTSGGLNSFYTRNLRKYDVGLHALTNYVPSHIKGSPLAKLLRQLRISREELGLCEQMGSSIKSNGRCLRFNNHFELLESEVAREFPHEVDGFQKLLSFIKNFNELSLDNLEASTVATIKLFIKDPELINMILLPLFYYGSSQENDMDLNQFVIMFKSIFLEGFCKPQEGVRRIIRLLTHKYRMLGGGKLMNCAVKRIIIDKNKAIAIELADGQQVTANTILSSAGAIETQQLCHPTPPIDPTNIGQLSFVEAILSIKTLPRNWGFKDTIIFFNNNKELSYRKPQTMVDEGSGVICFPENYQFLEERLPQEGSIRMTLLANYDLWNNLTPALYRETKEKVLKSLVNVLKEILPGSNQLLEGQLIDTDLFTPLTIKRFTGHMNGAVYGCPHKFRHGQTPYENLFLCGTDQGFLGIVGSILSGISMANLHILKEK